MLFSKVPTRGLVSSRMVFPSRCEPAQRLKDILQAYRRENYSREIPTRFKKEILISPFVASNGTVQVEQLNQLLVNIGYADHRLSPKEQQVLLKEAGSIDGCSIGLEKIMQLLDQT